MCAQKSVKDSVHGYIEFTEAFRNIIDTPEFQRLKWVEQTSFRVLYPSARHDRFIHSIGVFHLGGIAFDALMTEKDGVISRALKDANMDANKVKELKESFLAACLLHDVGHAPMSHTLEDLYYQNEPSKNLDGPLQKRLLNAIRKSGLTEAKINAFENDYRSMYPNKTEEAEPSENGETGIAPPKAHEIVSSIIVLERVKNLNLTETMLSNLDLIVRAIMGCTYVVTGNNKAEVGIKNCLIRLLNGRSVDVDKLDYITRDSAMSGHQNADIDNMRLLKAMTAYKDEHENIYPAFRKSALSVIKNVVFAKNAQAQWIIAHPSVVYESYILNKSIEDMMRLFVGKYCRLNDDGPICQEFFCNNPKACATQKCAIQEPEHLMNRLFSVEALSVEGLSIQGRRFRLLCDADIINLMKEFMDKSIFIRQFFDRSQRHKPLWKSQEEYAYFFVRGDIDKRQDVYKLFRSILIIGQEREKNQGKGVLVDDNLRNHVERENIRGAQKAIELLREFSEYGDFLLHPVSVSFSTDIDYNHTYFVFNNEMGNYITYAKLEGRMNMEQESDSKKERAASTPFYIYAPVAVDREKVLTQLISTIGGLYERA